MAKRDLDPRDYRTMRDTQLTLRINSGHKARLAQIAAEEGRTVAGMIDRIIVEYLNRIEPKTGTPV